jgi:hypothetical protein
VGQGRHQGPGEPGAWPGRCSTAAAQTSNLRGSNPWPPDIARHAESDELAVQGNPSPPPDTHSPAGDWEITLGIITAAGVVGGIVYVVVTAL